MTEREALLRAIIEDPEDDAPRLVFADWLDEHGDSDRAEFIRAQCEIHRAPASDDRWRALVGRCEALLEANGARWMKGVPGPPGIRWLGRHYRGFLHHAGAPRWADLRAAWGRLFATTPVIQLTVGAIAPRELNDFLARTETRSLRHVFLGVDGRIDAAAARLARDPAVAGWSVLDLRPGENDCLSDAAARALAESPHLGGLSRLHVPTTELTPDARLALQARFPDALA